MTRSRVQSKLAYNETTINFIIKKTSKIKNAGSKISI